MQGCRWRGARDGKHRIDALSWRAQQAWGISGKEMLRDGLERFVLREMRNFESVAIWRSMAKKTKAKDKWVRKGPQRIPKGKAKADNVGKRRTIYVLSQSERQVYASCEDCLPKHTKFPEWPTRNGNILIEKLIYSDNLLQQIKAISLIGPGTILWFISTTVIISHNKRLPVFNCAASFIKIRLSASWVNLTFIPIARY